jgi:carbonic anhydrase
MTSTQALDQLRRGNDRFARNFALRPHGDELRRESLLAGQAPLAAVLGCSDSRVPPEIIFDCGLGDLFVVRTGAQVLDSAGLGSLCYAVEHLGVPLAVVLGHTDCGAIGAAHAIHTGHRTAHGLLAAMLAPLASVMAEVAGHPDPLAAGVEHQVDLTVARLTSELAPATVLGAVYDLASGVVTFRPAAA